MSRYAKNKGLSFQKKVAEIVALRYNLKIAPLSTKSAGKGLYAKDGEQADLLIKSMGLSGADIIPVSDKARASFPFSVECKAIKATNDIASVLSKKTKVFEGWWEQAIRNKVDKTAPLIAFKCNNSMPIIVFLGNKKDIDALNGKSYCTLWDGITMIEISDFLEVFDRETKS